MGGGAGSAFLLRRREINAIVGRVRPRPPRGDSASTHAISSTQTFLHNCLRGGSGCRPGRALEAGPLRAGALGGGGMVPKACDLVGRTRKKRRVAASRDSMPVWALFVRAVRLHD